MDKRNIRKAGAERQHRKWSSSFPTVSRGATVIIFLCRLFFYCPKYSLPRRCLSAGRIRAGAFRPEFSLFCRGTSLKLDFPVFESCAVSAKRSFASSLGCPLVRSNIDSRIVRNTPVRNLGICYEYLRIYIRIFPKFLLSTTDIIDFYCFQFKFNTK